jgi:excisionase family DNA binding protein
MDPKRLTITVDEAAQKLGICRNAAYAAVKSGELPSIKIGRRVLVPLVALEKMLSNRAAA